MPLSEFYPEMKDWTPAENPEQPKPTIPDPNSQSGAYLRAPLPLPMQYAPDTLKQYNKPGLSSFRIAPLPPGGAPSVNSASGSVTKVFVSNFVSGGTGIIAAAGPNQAVQFNLGGAFSGVNQFLWNNGTSTLNITGNEIITAPAFGGLTITGPISSGLFLTNPVAATALANQLSPLITISGNSWNGSASITDSYIIENIVGSGSNPPTTLQFSHTGSSGQTGFQMNGLLTVSSGILSNTFITATTSLTAPFINLIGATSGSAKITVAAVTGTPNPINLPTTTGSSGQILSTDGGNPQQTSWISGSSLAFWNTTIKTTTYTAVAGDTVLANTSGGGFTVTLPASSANVNKSVRVKKTSSDANNVTVGVTGGDLIDGQATQVFNSQYTNLEVIADGAGNWWIV